jgi:hypothetical protein
MNTFVVKKTIDDCFDFEIKCSDSQQRDLSSHVSMMNKEIYMKVRDVFINDPGYMLTVDIESLCLNVMQEVLNDYCQKEGLDKSLFTCQHEWNYNYDSENAAENHVPEAGDIRKLISSEGVVMKLKNFNEIKKRKDEGYIGKNKPATVVFRLDGESPDSEG